MDEPQANDRANGNKAPEGIVLTEAQKKSRRERSIAIACALGLLAILFFAVTMVRGPAMFAGPM